MYAKHWLIFFALFLSELNFPVHNVQKSHNNLYRNYASHEKELNSVIPDLVMPVSEVISDSMPFQIRRALGSDHYPSGVTVIIKLFEDLVDRIHIQGDGMRDYLG